MHPSGGGGRGGINWVLWDNQSLIVQELCESPGGRPGLSVLMSLLVSVDVRRYHFEPCSGIGLSLSLICQLTSQGGRRKDNHRAIFSSSGAAVFCLRAKVLFTAICALLSVVFVFHSTGFFFFFFSLNNPE